ncbi:MAG TPA: hypothetical protein VGN79_07385 [Devosia sp.]|jgi:hypothetical protein|nr:hypothetical protein [Devosia sp.]
MIRSAWPAFLALVTVLSLAAPTVALAQGASNAQLCRWQVEMLTSRDKLTDAEVAAFQAQCDCLEQQESGRPASVDESCTREWTP